MKTIRRDELQAKIERGEDFVLLETLAAASYAHGHLPGAINLPLAEVDSRAADLLPELDADIVVYCGSVICDAGARAISRLEKLGYTNLSYYHGGKADWKEAGLPMESGPAA